MNYAKMIAFLDRTWTKASPIGTIDRYPFDEFQLLLAARGNPHLGMTTIHITGSKGKGSVTAMTAALMRAHGVPCVTFTSPHLNAIEERIQTGDGTSIDREELARRITELIAVSEQVGHDPRAIIRLLLVATFEHARDNGVTAAAIEVSMGGRFDPTNVVDGTVTAITAIGMEHVPRLGLNVAEIAAQKVAIVKPGRICVIAPQRADAMRVIEAGVALAGGRILETRELPDPLTTSNENAIGAATRYFEFTGSSEYVAGFKVRSFNSKGIVADLATPFHSFENVRIAIRGRHQAENAAVALNAVEQGLATRGIRLDDRSVRAGLATVEWPGRLELLREMPPVVYDGAHTAESAAVLAAALRDHFPNDRWTFVVGMLTRRDIGAILSELAPIACEFIAVPVPGFDAVDPAEIAARAAPLGVPFDSAENVAAALHRRKTTSICITGTLYLYTESKQAVVEIS